MDFPARRLAQRQFLVPGLQQSVLQEKAVSLVERLRALRLVKKYRQGILDKVCARVAGRGDAEQHLDISEIDPNEVLQAEREAGQDACDEADHQAEGKVGGAEHRNPDWGDPPNALAFFSPTAARAPCPNSPISPQRRRAERTSAPFVRCEFVIVALREGQTAGAAGNHSL